MSKDYDDYKQVAKSRMERNKKKESFKLVPGLNTFRVLMTPKGKTSPSRVFEYMMHNDVGPNKNYVRCGKDPATGKGSCYICDEVIPKLKKKGKEGRAAALAPQIKLIVQVATISKSGKWRGPFTFYPSKKTADELVANIIMSTTRDYLDPKRGFNLNVRRTGTGFKDTRYSSIEAELEPSKVPTKILEELVPFDQLKLPTYSKEMQKKALEGAALGDFKEKAKDSSAEGSSDYDEDTDMGSSSSTASSGSGSASSSEDSASSSSASSSEEESKPKRKKKK